MAGLFTVVKCQLCRLEKRRVEFETEEVAAHLKIHF